MTTLWSALTRHSVVIILVLGVTRAQYYGPPGHNPGSPIGSEASNTEYGTPSAVNLQQSQEYNAPQSSYGAINVASQSSYGAPEPNTVSQELLQAYAGPILSSSQSAYNAPASTSYGAPASGASTSYGVPSGVPVSSSYGVPASGASSSYGVPPSSGGSDDGSRYRVVPSSNYALPEQHSNLIRYIVLKEFRLGPNGSASPFQIDQQLSLGRNTAGANGGYPGSMEIMKVELPGSEEIRGGGYSQSSRNNQAGGYSDNNTDDDEDYDADGAEEDNSVDDEQKSSSDSDDDSDNNNTQDDYDDQGDNDDDIDNNSVDSSSSQRASASNLPSTSDGVPMQVVPARGVDLTSSGRRPATTQRQSSETQAFMFSDPESGSGEVRRQSTANRNRNQQGSSGGVRNQLRNTVNRNRPANRNQNRPNQNRNQNRQNQNRNQNRPNQNRNQNRSNRNRNRNRPSGTTAGASGSDGLPPIGQLTDALSLVARYFSAQAQLLRSTGQEAGGIAGSLLAPSSYSNINGTGASGPYPASGQSESGSSSSSVSGGGGSSSSSGSSQSGIESATQATFPASTYGPPPGSPGFGGHGSLFPNLAGAVVRPIQQFAGFKSSILNHVVTGLSGLGQGANGGGGGGHRGETGGFLSGGHSSSSTGSGASTLAPVYGPPSSSGGGAGVGGLISGIKGSIVTTIGNKGRAAVGIVGTKGRLASNQLQTTAHIASKGLSQTLQNKHEAFQGVIKHIQSIFNSNPNLLNQGRW